MYPLNRGSSILTKSPSMKGSLRGASNDVTPSAEFVNENAPSLINVIRSLQTAESFLLVMSSI